MILLKLERRLILQCRMATMRIIPPFDVLEHIPDRFLPAPVITSVHTLVNGHPVSRTRGKREGSFYHLLPLGA
jgi:hypothetical protein